MSNIKTLLICIRDIKCSDGKKYNLGQEYIYFKNDNYIRMYYSIYCVKHQLQSTVGYDFLNDNFIEKSELDNIDNMYQKYFNVT